MAEDQPATASRPGGSIKFYVFGGAVVVAAVVAVGYFHLSRSQDVATAREARANLVDRGPRVEVGRRGQGPNKGTIPSSPAVAPTPPPTMKAKAEGTWKP